MNQPGDWRDRHVLTDDFRESLMGMVEPASISLRVQRSCSLASPLKCLELLKPNYKVAAPVIIPNARRFPDPFPTSFIHKWACISKSLHSWYKSTGRKIGLIACPSFANNEDEKGWLKILALSMSSD